MDMIGFTLCIYKFLHWSNFLRTTAHPLFATRHVSRLYIMRRGVDMPEVLGRRCVYYFLRKTSVGLCRPTRPIMNTRAGCSPGLSPTIQIPRSKSGQWSSKASWKTYMCAFPLLLYPWKSSSKTRNRENTLHLSKLVNDMSSSTRKSA